MTGIVLDDPRYDRSKEPSKLDAFFIQYLRDKRDLPFIYTALKQSAVVFPFAVLLFWPGMFRWWLAAIYLVYVLGLNLGPFILMLHNTSHRTLFKRQYRALNHYVPWVLGPFFGETPDTYYVHHVLMHHAENNLDPDLSCTMRYQRDSFFGFMHYFLKFFFVGLGELAIYQWKRRNHHFLRRMIAGELGFYVLAIALTFYNWQASLVVFGIPFLVARFGMMAGNWGQHAFIDASDPGNSYRNTITCINSGYNKACFNDGYHIGHHVRPTRHWTDMPADFERDLPKYREEGSIIFEGLDFFIVWALLMAKRYDKLAKHFVDLETPPRSHDDIVALLKERTRRISPEQVPLGYALNDRVAALRAGVAPVTLAADIPQNE